MADGLSDKTAPAELVAAALNKPTLRIAGMKTKLGGGVLTSPALIADGKKTHEEPALCVSAAVFFQHVLQEDWVILLRSKQQILALVLDRFHHWVLMERELMTW
jgi:hypothetical protein